MSFLWRYQYKFFFVKQKTAYELRISDWSSDVCSSDLLVPSPVNPSIRKGYGRTIQTLRRAGIPLCSQIASDSSISENSIQLHSGQFRLGSGFPTKIGRASCRE